MSMEPCARCGEVDPHLMFGLMSRWFAAPAGVPLDGGYFYLCPTCFDANIAPDLADILDRLREHHPAPGSAKPPSAEASEPDAASAPPSSAEPVRPE